MVEEKYRNSILKFSAGELSGLVQRMMGHETLQIIYEKYNSYIKNYQLDDGKAFMENVYNAGKDENVDEDRPFIA